MLSFQAIIIAITIVIHPLEIFQHKVYANNITDVDVGKTSTVSGLCSKQKVFLLGCKVNYEIYLNISLKESQENKTLNKISLSKKYPNGCCHFHILNYTKESKGNVTCTPSDEECIYEIFVEACKMPYLIPDLHFHAASVCPKYTSLKLVPDDDIKPQFLPEICPVVSNLSVKAFYLEKHDSIRLNISWSEAKIEDTTIQIESKQSECYSIKRFNHPLKSKFLIEPNLEINPVDEVKPECNYTITFGSCRLNYTVPECVEQKCNCDKYKPLVEILKIESDSGDDFIIMWKPVINSNYNRTNDIMNVSFQYRRKGPPEQDYLPTENIHIDTKKNTAKIKIYKIPKDEEYKLMGTFRNYYKCECTAQFVFKVHETNSNIYLFFIISIIVIMLLGLKHKLITKYIKKVLNIGLDQLSSNQPQSSLQQITGSEQLVPLQVNLQYTPAEILDGSCDKFEISRRNIFMKEKIGSGAFGQVFSAKAYNIDGDTLGNKRMVAVKTLDDRASKEERDDFLAEIEIFKKIGDHPNIVRLLGCCTLDVPFMMIMEFVPCGDLKNYLLDLRKQWLLKKSDQVFFPDNSDGAYIDPSVPYPPVSITSSRLPSASETILTCLEDPLTPLLVDYKDTLQKILDHNELQNFALQIAQGMAYLEKISITHRDLAARNVLINEYKKLKISDFGLSRKGPYINCRTRKLPLRWMAPESIYEQTYDSRSDVWSFGIVLWEIGTLGAFPYEDVLDNFLVQFLSMGKRLKRPEICTDALYELMKQCWILEPEKRPTFEKLVDTLNVNKRKMYVDFSQLNPMYVFPPCGNRDECESDT